MRALSVGLILAAGCSTPDSYRDKEPYREALKLFGAAVKVQRAPLKLEEEYPDECLPLIEELRTLPENFTREEFYSRRALSRLMAMGSSAFPILKQAFLYGGSSSIKLSAGYLLHTMDRELWDDEVRTRFYELFRDPDPVVRSMSARYLVEGHDCGESWRSYANLHPQEVALAEHFGWGPYLGWMHPDDQAQGIRNALKVVEGGGAYFEPVVCRVGISIQKGDAHSVRCAQSRMITRDHYMAEGFINLAFASTDGHRLRVLVLDALDQDDGSDPSRLGRKFRLVGWGHQHKATDCERFDAEYKSRLALVAERWMWKTTDPLALYHIVWLVGPENRKELAARHHNPEVRELAKSP